jgi:GntR family transcriptional repressor for pyruvate dehydrogenase complex
MPRSTSPTTSKETSTAKAGEAAPADPSAHKRFFERIANDIRISIADGRRKAGDRLPSERELAEQFGVSRNTVREAFRSLENAGLLVLRRGPGGGAFVASGYGGVVRTGMSDLVSLGLVKAQHLGEARIVIGVATARFAAERRTYGDLEALARNMEETEAAVKAGEVERWTRLSFEFHRLLAKATQNPALVVLTDAVIELNDQMVKAAGLRNPKQSALFRKKMFKHIEARDADSAVTEMEQYLDMLRRYYQAKLG